MSTAGGGITQFSMQKFYEKGKAKKGKKKRLDLISLGDKKHGLLQEVFLDSGLQNPYGKVFYDSIKSTKKGK